METTTVRLAVLLRGWVTNSPHNPVHWKQPNKLDRTIMYSVTFTKFCLCYFWSGFSIHKAAPLVEMEATKALAVHRKGKEEVLHSSLSAALVALEPEVQSGLACNHVSSAGITKTMPRILADPKKMTGKVNPVDWLHKKKVDSLVVVTANIPNLESIRLSTSSSCSGNFTSGFSGPAFIGGKKTAESLTATQLRACINSKHGELCLVSYLQLDLPQRLMTAMCHISSPGYPPQSHWDSIQRNSVQCGEW